MNPEKITSQTEKTSEIPKQGIGHKLLSLFTAKKSGETAANDTYLLSEHLTPKEKKVWKDLVNYWDNIDISIDGKLGSLIEQYVRDPNYQFGIHRSNEINGNKPKTDGVLHSIMQNGLVVLGDSKSGSIRNDADPSKTVSFCNNILDAVIMTKSGRQGSNGAVLVAIPSEYVDKEGDLLPCKAEKVYDYDKIGNAYIKPEFILGFAPGGGQRGAHIEFISKEEILNN